MGESSESIGCCHPTKPGEDCAVCAKRKDAYATAKQYQCPTTRKVFEIVLASLNYDGPDIDSLTVGEIRRALP